VDVESGLNLFFGPVGILVARQETLFTGIAYSGHWISNSYDLQGPLGHMPTITQAKEILLSGE
jgi:hypothetical protein